MIAYHIYLLVKIEKTIVELNQCLLVLVQPANAGVTHSIAEVCQPQCDQLEPDSVKSGYI